MPFANREKQLMYWAQYQKDHPADPAKKRAASRANHQRLRAQVIAAYGGKCECCGEAEPEFLCLDHRHGGGTAERRRTPCNLTIYRRARDLGFPPEFRILCHNCNQSAHLGGGICAHQRGARHP